MVFINRISINIFGFLSRHAKNSSSIPQINRVLSHSLHHEVSILELESNIVKLLLKQGHSQKNSDIITETLMYAELRGNNQGIVKLITNGLLPSDLNMKDVEILYETPVSSKLNGNQNIGMVVLSHSVDTAIEKAKTLGVGIVGCSNYSSGLYTSVVFNDFFQFNIRICEYYNSDRRTRTLGK